MSQAAQMARTFLVSTKSHVIVTPNPEICLKAYHDLNLTLMIKYADLSLPDGVGLRFGAALLGTRLHNKVTGVDFSDELFRLAREQGSKVVLIGGKGKSGTKALENVKKKYPGINVDYVNGGFFDDQGVSEYPDFLERLKATQPDIVLVNLGAPKQERFIAHAKNYLGAKILIGVGGTIDFLSGDVRRAPRLLQVVGLEWLYRLMQQPWRWKRILHAVILFPLYCIYWRIRNVFIYRKGVTLMIVNDSEEILIAKRKPRPGEQHSEDHWQLPQGGIDHGELPEQTAHREAFEELGLRNLEVVDISKNCYTYTWSSYAKLIMPYKGQRATAVLMKYSGDLRDVRPDHHEFTDFRWVSKHHILEIIHPLRKENTALILRKFERHFS
jgi:N-acetylglucosaminyldiphosphoundecaprenol N-acetyl-beta-D-mannosaminyltransferase